MKHLGKQILFWALEGAYVKRGVKAVSQLGTRDEEPVELRSTGQPRAAVCPHTGIAAN
jgi:hypothetical protein